MLKKGDIIRIESDYVTLDGAIINNHYFLIIETGYDFSPYIKGLEFDIEALSFTSLNNSKGIKKIDKLLYNEDNIPVYEEDYVNGKLYDSVVKCNCVYILYEKNIQFVLVDSLKKEKLNEIQQLVDSRYEKDELELNVNNIDKILS